MSELRVLFEDEYLISVIKPYGVLSQGNENTKSIVDDISSYLTEKGERGEIFVIHRLDKTTGGVMVFAKTKEATAKMSAIVQNGEFHKVYNAVVCGEIEEKSGKLWDLLYHDKGRNKTYVVKRERKGVKKAGLSYNVLSVKDFSGAKVSKVEVQLHTGRTHQIRVQFAFRKHPLVGDKKYGCTVSYKNIALWSKEISFIHPMKNELLTVSAEPESEIFDIF
ncbi:MAG: RluA family pseudouridine synthase [Ruminococcus sp.]|nr:RluA family pseudouridine synthase [Ruminococcus sp.]